ncbi:MAG TPA: GNAT family N-acetyltransferase [Candidatus Methylomirabilis sp.]|nr:GNAT family N-acetyltransferase [Candidatus Methylomirabilis sp.]HSB79368.1 GNAT family N-acetyltransferase [Candidatus Methylomirabilis sp.]
MVDILVKLYDLQGAPRDIPGVEIRRPMPHEKGMVKQWIAKAFSEAWGEEFECSFKSLPVTTLIALRDDKVVGFACYDVTCRGYFGPTGVLESERGKGIGKELLMRSMLGLRELGYAYAIIGAAGPVEFYVKTLGGFPIPGSSEGIYPKKLSG